MSTLPPHSTDLVFTLMLPWTHLQVIRQILPCHRLLPSPHQNPHLPLIFHTHLLPITNSQAHPRSLVLWMRLESPNLFSLPNIRFFFATFPHHSPFLPNLHPSLWRAKLLTDGWLEIHEEFNFLIKNQTWSLVPSNLSMNIVNSK